MMNNECEQLQKYLVSACGRMETRVALARTGNVLPAGGNL